MDERPQRIVDYIKTTLDMLPKAFEKPGESPPILPKQATREELNAWSRYHLYAALDNALYFAERLRDEHQ
jgi:hypothetical protein